MENLANEIQSQFYTLSQMKASFGRWAALAKQLAEIVWNPKNENEKGMAL